MQDSVELSDHQILCVVIAFCERDLSPTSMSLRLFAEFGTLSAIISAPAARLKTIDSMTDRLIAFIKFLHVFKLKSLQSGLPQRISIRGCDDLRRYLTARLMNNSVEELYGLFLDNDCNLLSIDLLGRGTSNRVAAYPVEIAKRAVQLGAVKIILAHNHPSRRTKPSFDDIALTRSVASTCAPLNITIEDHVIIAGDEYISMRELYLIPPALGNLLASEWSQAAAV